MPKQEYPQDKTCTKCGQAKPLDEFNWQRSNKDGRQGRCKACVDAQNRKWYRENQARKIAANGRWRRENRERVSAQLKRHRECHPEKARARHRLNEAVRAGKLSKSTCCESCGARTESRELDGHHEDYDKPLDVEWLCRRCHAARHLCCGR